MRLPVLFFSLLAAARASAQPEQSYERINVRRYTSGMTGCQFRDIPALSLWVSADGTGSNATYRELLKHAGGRVEIQMSYVRHAEGP
jgi:hypothetical protein